jgi:hypothetical protein
MLKAEGVRTRAGTPDLTVFVTLLLRAGASFGDAAPVLIVIARRVEEAVFFRDHQTDEAI